MRASSRTLLLASSLAAAVLFPCFVQGDAHAEAVQTPYPACTTKPTPQDSEAAHSAYLLGKRFFEESDYGSASHNFIDAFKLDCTKPELLLNIARANELLGNRAEAVHALETYMQRGQTLTPDDKTQLQRRIDNLKAAIAAAAPPPVAAPAPTPTATPAAVAMTAPPAAATPQPPIATEDRHHSAGPWVVIGIGAAAFIAGGVTYLVGAGKLSSANSECPNGSVSGCTATGSQYTKALSDYNSGTTLHTAGEAVFWSGAAVAVAGILWHFLEPTGPVTPEVKTTFVPVFGPGYAGGGLSGRF